RGRARRRAGGGRRAGPGAGPGRGRERRAGARGGAPPPRRAHDRELSTAVRTLAPTTPPMRGPDVTAVQRRLPGLDPDGEYGPLTAQAVAAWKWRSGYPL